MSDGKPDRQQGQHGGQQVQQGPQGQKPEQLRQERRDDFTIRTKEATWSGGKIVMQEPPLQEGVELADAFFDFVMEEVDGKNLMRMRVRQAEYMAAVCARYFRPSINVKTMPTRLYKEIRRLIDEWEDFSGMGELRETIRAQTSDES